MEYGLQLFSIILINLLLSGDNALVIALASRNLPLHQQKKAMLYGCIGAILLRVALTFAAISLLKIPYLQMIAGILLFWIAIKLMAEQKGCEQRLVGKKSVSGVIKTIITADFVMSLDNVIAVIGVAKDNIGLLVLGIAISIPIIIWGSKFVCLLMRKWPIIISFGSFFLGWTAAQMILSDYHIVLLLGPFFWLNNLISGISGLIVVVIGKFLGKK
ncbi:TerC family protein [Pelosinus propionicus]|uniref:Integral membrane protein, YjbE family n=1 Tax=Pelosinus propionicus DSM 13327 TaxID=1123291 RepID=A0A1I4PJN6_9FIRM|nr:TerC family protein [Pelosinus propionicus]SFM27786.1 integral membrane protein, YjbE family [Pelosinus propionicus DSM 13327]